MPRGQAKITFFRGNSYVGTTKITYPFSPPSSMLLVCSTCGEVWGRVLVEDSAGQVVPWEPDSVPCEQHQEVTWRDWGTIPGSMISRFFSRARTCSSPLTQPSYAWANVFEHIPDELLKLEFKIHLDYFSKEIES